MTSYAMISEFAQQTDSTLTVMENGEHWFHTEEQMKFLDAWIRKGKGENNMEHKGTEILETERLILRPFTEEDASSVFNNWANDYEVTKYLTWQSHRNVEDSLGYMKYCIQGYEKKAFYQWGIVIRETDELIGNISVVHMDDAIEAVELGYVIGRKFWGNGYMPEAVRRVIAFMFDEVGANRVAARHDINNPNSGKVMKKAGMTYEGTLRQCDRNNQGIVDCAYYAVLRSEYETEK